MMKRRRPEELEPHECWQCDCGKVYKKTSVHSIGRHKERCVLWLGANPQTRPSLLEEIERCIRITRTCTADNQHQISVSVLLINNVFCSISAPSSRLNFESVFASVDHWGELSIGRFIIEPTLNAIWIDSGGSSMLSLDVKRDRHPWNKVTKNTSRSLRNLR
mmetsp:Transcript_17174/g.27446  ORF Transcript_17174/g.27446 Transcript_17174/m.27446 type:complete len:162 (+) Transcript_17174:81-566(+)